MGDRRDHEQERARDEGGFLERHSASHTSLITLLLLNPLFVQVQANIHSLVILYVDRDLFRQMEGLAICGFYTLEIGSHQIVGLAGGNTLGEFAGMIRIDFPLGLLIRHAADPHRYAINGAIVGPPDRPENQSIW